MVKDFYKSFVCFSETVQLSLNEKIPKLEAKMLGEKIDAEQFISSLENECLLCHKTFHTVSSVRRHVRFTHLKERTFTCAACPSKFAERHKLKKHMEKNHPTSSSLMSKVDSKVATASVMLQSDSHLMKQFQEESKLDFQQTSGQTNSKSDDLSLPSQLIASKRKSVEVQAENKHLKTYHSNRAESTEALKQKNSPKMTVNDSSEVKTENQMLRNNQMATVLSQNDQALPNNLQIPKQQLQNCQGTILSQVQKVQHPPKDQALPRQSNRQQLSQNVQSMLPLNENHEQKRNDKLSVKKVSKNSHHRFAPR